MTATETTSGTDRAAELMAEADFRAMFADQSGGTTRFLVLADWCRDRDAERDCPELVLALRAMHEPVKVGQHTYTADRHEFDNKGTVIVSYSLYAQHPAARSRWGKCAAVGSQFGVIVSGFADVLQHEKNKQARKDRKKAAHDATLAGGHTIAVGTLLYHSWGYDETHYDFAQVVKVGPRSVTVRRIAAQSLGGEGPMSARIAPMKDAFLQGDQGKPKLCMLSVWNGKVHVRGWSEVAGRETFTETWGH